MSQQEDVSAIAAVLCGTQNEAPVTVAAEYPQEYPHVYSNLQ